jgi:hypothetical protein
MPAAPIAPQNIEFAKNGIAGGTTNPFNAQQQVQDWSASWYEASVSIPAMNLTNGQLWAAFITALDGIANVFQFSTALCTLMPVELTSDGTTPRFWCLKPPGRVQWHVKPGMIYSLTFEIREALP